MNPDAKIYVAGHRGLVGSAIVRRLTTPSPLAGEGRGEGERNCPAHYTNIITRTHAELDLTDQHAVRDFFEHEKPEYVFLAAAKVGGILANSTYPADFIYQNLAIQTNVIHESWRHGVKRLLFLGSSCIYPRDCPQPIKEEYLLTGTLEETNKAYALAKIAGIEMCAAYNQQHGTQFLCVMPSNSYGLGDNYDLQNSHVLPALLRKFHEAKERGDKEVAVWGTGTPRREFIYSDDLAEACVHLTNLSDAVFKSASSLQSSTFPLINVGCGEDITIRDLAVVIKQVVDYQGAIVFDASKPDGTPRKLLDISQIKQMGWMPRTSLLVGISKIYDDFCR